MARRSGHETNDGKAECRGAEASPPGTKGREDFLGFSMNFRVAPQAKVPRPRAKEPGRSHLLRQPRAQRSQTKRLCPRPGGGPGSKAEGADRRRGEDNTKRPLFNQLQYAGAANREVRQRSRAHRRREYRSRVHLNIAELEATSFSPEASHHVFFPSKENPADDPTRQQSVRGPKCPP